MKKFILVSMFITVAGIYTSNAQSTYFAPYYHQFNTNYGYFKLATAAPLTIEVDPVYTSLSYLLMDTDKDYFQFTKPVRTSSVETVFSSDLNFKVNGITKLQIRNSNGYIYIPFNTNLVFGDNIAEGSHRIRILQGETHGYIDYKDNLHFRADLNWISALTLYGNGTVGVGFNTTYDLGDYRTQEYKLAVNGGILCEEVKVITDVPNADYVFEKNYPLAPLSEVEKFIKENQHLPDIPSAEEFKTNGYKVGEMDEMLLRKVEELTLYIIELEKQIKELKSEIKKGGE
jgi:hypothetical protein